MALVFWSAVLWFLFEAFNFRLANWYYVFVPDSLVVRFVGSWLSFGTVLPALFLIEKLLEDLGLFKSAWRISLRLTQKTLNLMALLGVLSLTLSLVFPRYAFPLVWVWGILLPLPLLTRYIKRPFLKDLETGSSGRVLRILAAGLVCGFIWEFLNFFARTRWIYTVPFLEDLKLFEMPPLGFLGFPFFALACHALYGLWVGLGLAPQVEGLERIGPPRYLLGFISGGAALLFGCLVLWGMERYTIDSYTPRPEELSLPGAVLSLAEQGGYEDCFQLKKALENPALRSMLRNEGVDTKQVNDQMDLVLLRGIGSENAMALFSLGVASISDLASQDPHVLAAALSKDGSKQQRRVRCARAKVWIKAGVGKINKSF
jgi:hypothetical protein